LLHENIDEYGQLNDMNVKVPLELSEDPSYADWKLIGTVKLRFDARGEQPLLRATKMKNEASDDDADQSN
jgi:hypothetical protein